MRNVKSPNCVVVFCFVLRLPLVLMPKILMSIASIVCVGCVSKLMVQK